MSLLAETLISGQALTGLRRIEIRSNGQFSGNRFLEDLIKSG